MDIYELSDKVLRKILVKWFSELQEYSETTKQN